MVSAIADVLKLHDSPLCMKEGQALPNFARFLSILENLSNTKWGKNQQICKAFSFWPQN